jgi:hypothetical protein
MQECKFLLGQTVYSATEYQMNRYVITEFLTHETKEGVKLEVIVENPIGRKEGYSVEDVNTYFFDTFEEAKALALQNWEAHVKNVTTQLEAFTNEGFDEAVRRYEEKQKAKEQK